MDNNEEGEEPLLTENERAWLRFLRDLSSGRDPAPTLRRVQLLRRTCEARRE